MGGLATALIKFSSWLSIWRLHRHSYKEYMKPIKRKKKRKKKKGVYENIPASTHLQNLFSLTQKTALF